MKKRNIIVIGASAGGFEVIKEIVAGLPLDLEAAVFIVWHMSADIRGVLPEVLNKQQTLYAANAIDNEPIKFNRIYVAPPDRHLIIEKDHVRVTHGPKENRFRPAVDPLFRSAAYCYGPGVIGVILSGALDDGTAGLWSIKNRGGIAIVQDPAEAQVSAMPANALRAVAVDYTAPAAGIASLLTKLTSEDISQCNIPGMEESNEIKKEINVVIPDKASNGGILQLGELTPYTCPECHGVLSAIKEGLRIRYRCHTGHAFSADTLLETLTENIEHSIWNALRGMEESVIFLNHMGDHFAEINQPHLAAMYFQKANDVMERIKLLRQAVKEHEQLNTDIIKNDADRAGMVST